MDEDRGEEQDKQEEEGDSQGDLSRMGRYRRRKGVSLTQRRAIALRVQGLGAKEIAAELGINPGTLRNWSSGDELYRAELEQAVAQVQRDEMHRLRAHRSEALDVVLGAIKQKDTKVAQWYLQWSASQVNRVTPRGWDRLGETVDASAQGWEVELFAATEWVTNAARFLPMLRSDPFNVFDRLYLATQALHEALSLCEGEGPRALAGTDPRLQCEALDRAEAALRRAHDAHDPVPDDANPGVVDPAELLAEIAATKAVLGHLFDSLEQPFAEEGEVGPSGSAADRMTWWVLLGRDVLQGVDVPDPGTPLSGDLLQIGEGFIEAIECLVAAFHVSLDQDPENRA